MTLYGQERCFIPLTIEGAKQTKLPTSSKTTTDFGSVVFVNFGYLVVGSFLLNNKNLTDILKINSKEQLYVKMCTF